MSTLLTGAGSGVVAQRFEKFLSNITLTDQQIQDGTTKHQGIVSCLNRRYCNQTSSTDNAKLVGSWGKLTRIRPPRDIDVLFQLPYEVYTRFEQRPGNKQSQLLQEVKGVLVATYPNTDIRSDRHVVAVPFLSYAVEVVPAFKLTSGKYWVCDTNDGGNYKTFDPDAEKNHIEASNKSTGNKTRDLIRMLKCWQKYCDVPLKSFIIELLVIDFLKTWQYRDKGKVYYDWMVRDFFAQLKGLSTWGWVTVPGTNESLYLTGDWKTKAETAHLRAAKACGYESSSPSLAGIEWQKIFGTDIPVS